MLRLGLGLGLGPALWPVRRHVLGRCWRPLCCAALPDHLRPASAASSSSLIVRDQKFRDLGLSSSLTDALDALELHHPTRIQSRAIPLVLAEADAGPDAKPGSGDVLLASQAGSGKTLAFLLPVIQHLKLEEAQHERGGARGSQTPGRPRALVLVPNRELAYQILGVAKSLAHYAKFSSMAVSGGPGRAAQVKALERPVDLLVATPGRCKQLIDQKKLYLSKVSWVVVDEADTMLEVGAGFGPLVRQLFAPMRARNEKKPGSVRFVLSSASLKRSVLDLIRREFAEARSAVVDSLHHTQDTLEEQFVDVGGRDKMELLREVLRAQAQREEKDGLDEPLPTLVFCNTLASCRAVEHMLRESGLSVSCYHGQMPPEARSASFSAFMRGETPLMVATDMASRGLDTLFVKHVILFDFPLSPVDYLHRVGRTARAGTTGYVTAFVQKKDRVLARSIRQAKQMGITLENLSSTKQSKLDVAPLSPRDPEKRLFPLSKSRTRKPRRAKGSDGDSGSSQRVRRQQRRSAGQGRNSHGSSSGGRRSGNRHQRAA